MKILLCGNVGEENAWKILLDRLKDLQKSNHGPFGLLVFTGQLNIPNKKLLDQIEDQLMALRLTTIAFEVLIQSPPSSSIFSNSFQFIQLLPNSLGFFQSEEKITMSYFLTNHPTKQELDAIYQKIDSLADEQPQQEGGVGGGDSGGGYRGCDFCISNYWPMATELTLSQESLLTLNQSNLQRSGSHSNDILPLFINKLHPRYVFLSNLNGYYQRPPFPILFSSSGFDSQPKLKKLYCRLITLDQVSASKEKHQKYLHALSLIPLEEMKKEDLELEPSDATTNPYDHYLQEHQANNKRLKTSHQNSALATHFVSSGGKPPPPPLPPLQSFNAEGGAHSYFYGSVPNAPSLTLPPGSQRNRGQHHGERGGGENTKLFIGGLGPNIQEQQLLQIFPNAISVRKMKDKGYAFVDFANNQDALHYYQFAEQNQGSIKAFGRQLTVGWANTPSQQQPSPAQSQPPKLREPPVTIESLLQDESVLIPPNETCNSLFVGNIPSFPDGSPDRETEVKNQLVKLFPQSVHVQYRIIHPHYAFIEFENNEVAQQILKSFYEEWREYYAKHPPASDASSLSRKRKAEDDSAPPSDDVVENENPSDSNAVIVPPYQLFGRSIILKWSTISHHRNHQQHHQTMNQWSLLQEQPDDCSVIFLGNLPLSSSAEAILSSLQTDYHIPAVLLSPTITSFRQPEGRDYAFLECINAKTANELMNKLLAGYYELNPPQETTTVQYFRFGWAKGKPADKQLQSENCWFCLASPTVKLHLVVSVGEFAYLALPKGGINAYHILIIPIDCVPNRLHLSSSCKIEVDQFIHALRQFFQKSLRMNYLLFERSIRTTNGRDHMQIQLIPYDPSNFSSPMNAFERKAAEYSMQFSPLEEGVELDDYLVSSSDGPYQEYFYVDLPEEEDRVDGERRRRYVYVRSENQQKFPMSFGNEIAAIIINQPERGFWKNCVVSENEEVQMVETFREEFSFYDFTLKEENETN